MSTAIFLYPQAPQKFSLQMQAVLLILNADPYLKKNIEPFINFETETISWDQVLKIAFSSGHRAAITWSYCIWTDELRPRSNPFDAALSMDQNLQLAVLQALALRWGLKL